MLGTWLRDLREWASGTAVAIGLIMLFGVACVWPLMRLEGHHREVFRLIVIWAEILSIAFFWRCVHGPGIQTCPHCGKKFRGTDAPWERTGA